jgi:hypothetical protein
VPNGFEVPWLGLSKRDWKFAINHQLKSPNRRCSGEVGVGATAARLALGQRASAPS